VLEFQIEDRPVGSGRCFVIAEIAQAHDGSVGLAHAYIDAVARTGADAIKFQTHLAAAESTPSEPWRVRFSSQDATRYDYWKRMEFSPAQWADLRRHADEAGLVFLSSPFSLESVEMLLEVGVGAWKVASGETSHPALVERLVATHLPLLVSTGMSRFEEIDAVVALARAEGSPVAVLQCTSIYPCPADKVGLNNLEEFRKRYSCPVGLSDHSGTIYPALAARTLGADIVEVHVTMSREMFGPDVPSSVTTGELTRLVDGIRFTETMLANPTDKDEIARELAETRALFTRSIVAARDLAQGSRLEPGDLALKKPGCGLPASRLGDVVGRTLRRAVTRDELLSEADLA